MTEHRDSHSYRRCFEDCAGDGLPNEHWHPLPEPTLVEAGAELTRAKERYEEARHRARIAALKALSEGASESHVARVLKVDRMTVRRWQGKHQGRHLLEDEQL
jgi:hypothetical protein